MAYQTFTHCYGAWDDSMIQTNKKSKSKGSIPFVFHLSKAEQPPYLISFRYLMSLSLLVNKSKDDL